MQEWAILSIFVANELTEHDFKNYNVAHCAAQPSVIEG